MRLLVLVLNHIDKLAPLLKRLEEAGFRGATVLSSRGMGVILNKYFGFSILGNLYAMIEPDQDESKTIFMVIDQNEVQRAIQEIEKELGSLSAPNGGIAFTVPVDFVKGIL